MREPSLIFTGVCVVWFSLSAFTKIQDCVICKKKKYEDKKKLLVLLDLFCNRWRKLMYICCVLFYKCIDRKKRGIRMQDIQKLQISMLVESNKTKSPFYISCFPVATHGHSTSYLQKKHMPLTTFPCRFCTRLH
jgi:hypothetical protein